MWTSRIPVLFFSLFIVSVGFGLTLPVLPLYAERLALGRGASADTVALHVGALTAVYALAQVIFAPLWGRWADRKGRKPMIILGMTGFLIAQIMSGLATSLLTLYAARVIGGPRDRRRPVGGASARRRSAGSRICSPSANAVAAWHG